MKKSKEQFTEDLIENSPEKISKTKLKKQMEELQELGVKLIGLKEDKLLKLELPEELIIAIRLAKQIRSNSAMRRQRQYIGKLMREVDVILLKERMAKITK
jgi:ribosome-associated protein